MFYKCILLSKDFSDIYSIIGVLHSTIQSQLLYFFIFFFIVGAICNRQNR